MAAEENPLSFIRKYPLAALIGAAGILTAAAGYLQQAYDIWKNGIPAWQLQAAGFALFVLSIILLLYRWEASQKIVVAKGSKNERERTALEKVAINFLCINSIFWQTKITFPRRERDVHILLEFSQLYPGGWQPRERHVLKRIEEISAGETIVIDLINRGMLGEKKQWTWVHLPQQWPVHYEVTSWKTNAQIIVQFADGEESKYPFVLLLDKDKNSLSLLSLSWFDFAKEWQASQED